MRLFAKLLFVIFAVNGMVLGGVVAQRYFFPTYVETVLATDDGCGLDCWFGVVEEMNHRDVAVQIDRAGGRDQNFRGSFMRYRLPDPETGENRGMIQVALDGNGNVVQVCYFPKDVTVGDIISTFGEPVKFYLDSNSRRQIFSRISLELEAYIVHFEMIYPDRQLVFEGDMHISVEDLQEQGVSLHASINLMCNPGTIDYFWLDNFPDWEGIYVEMEDYFASPPPTASDGRDVFIDPLQFR